MPATPKGFPYPAATAPVAAGAADIQALATALDTFLSGGGIVVGRVSGGGVKEAGQGFTVVRTAVGEYTVTFAPAMATALVFVAIMPLNHPVIWSIPVLYGPPAATGFSMSLRSSGNVATDAQWMFMAVADTP